MRPSSAVSAAGSPGYRPPGVPARPRQATIARCRCPRTAASAAIRRRRPAARRRGPKPARLSRKPGARMGMWVWAASGRRLPSQRRRRVRYGLSLWSVAASPIPARDHRLVSQPATGARVPTMGTGPANGGAGSEPPRGPLTCPPCRKADLKWRVENACLGGMKCPSSPGTTSICAAPIPKSPRPGSAISWAARSCAARGGSTSSLAAPTCSSMAARPPATPMNSRRRPRPHQGLDHIGLTVKDIDAVAAEIKAKGVEFTQRADDDPPRRARSASSVARRTSRSSCSSAIPNTPDVHLRPRSSLQLSGKTRHLTFALGRMGLCRRPANCRVAPTETLWHKR